MLSACLCGGEMPASRLPVKLHPPPPQGTPHHSTLLLTLLSALSCVPLLTGRSGNSSFLKNYLDRNPA